MSKASLVLDPAFVIGPVRRRTLGSFVEHLAVGWSREQLGDPYVVPQFAPPHIPAAQAQTQMQAPYGYTGQM